MRNIVVQRCPSHGYEVLVADMINPGVVIAASHNRDFANEVCRRFAFLQGARAFPLTDEQEELLKPRPNRSLS